MEDSCRWFGMGYYRVRAFWYLFVVEQTTTGGDQKLINWRIFITMVHKLWKIVHRTTAKKKKNWRRKTHLSQKSKTNDKPQKFCSTRKEEQIIILLSEGETSEKSVRSDVDQLMEEQIYAARRDIKVAVMTRILGWYGNPPPLYKPSKQPF